MSSNAQIATGALRGGRRPGLSGRRVGSHAGLARAWDTNWGPLTITANGTQLSGAFGYSDSWNPPLGHITGAASGATLTGTWAHDPPSHFAPRDHGSVTLTVSVVDGKAIFKGDAVYEVDGVKVPLTGSCLSGACAQGIVAPNVTALPAAGKAGKTVVLRYRVSDDSGKSSERISVYRGAARIWSSAVRLRSVTSGATYQVAFKAPARAGTLRFTVQARDSVDNLSPVSPVSSAAISVR